MNHKKEKTTKLEKSWILYDIGNSAYILLVSTIIPIFFKNSAASHGIQASDSTASFSYAVSIATLIVVVIGPILGTLADSKGYKKPLFTIFLMLGVMSLAALAIPVSWILFLVIFVFAQVGVSGSLIFYDSMLNDITTDERMDSISSLGYAWGYLGSCIPFTISLLLIMFADKLSLTATVATGIAFLINAVWWFVITLPLLKRYKQIRYVEIKKNALKESFHRLTHVMEDMKSHKEIGSYLLAYFFYIDGVHTIISMATSYGKDVGINDNSLLFALLLTQVVAFPCSILFGKLTRKYKTRDLIRVCIIGYFLISMFALQLDKAWEFWFLAVCVAVFQGAIQALSRSYYAKIIPKEKSSEYFWFFDIFGKGASFMGTMLMGISTQVFGSSKAGVAVIGIMFVIGFVLFQKEPGKDHEIPKEFSTVER